MKHFLVSFSVVLSAVAGLGAVASAAPSNVLQLRADPSYFSPNHDGLQDQTFFYPVLRSNREVTRWVLEIRRASGKHVTRLTGAGFPALIKWDALDKRGNAVNDGAYVARLTVTGGSLKASAETLFVVDTTRPRVGVSISTPVIDMAFLSKEKFTFVPAVDEESPLDRWQLQILDVTGRGVRVFWSSGTARAVEWDGTDRATGVLVASGRYKGVYQVWDKAGNESEPTFVDFSMSITPREMLERQLSLLQVTQTPLGLLVQIDQKDLFVMKKGRPVLTPGGRKYLREAALLINAYPDVSVRLDGYSSKYKYQQNRKLSSAYAWSAYNYLVKRGHVTASRMVVRGRAKSPLFDRREVNFPIPQNGIEIILEGNREW